MGDHHEGALASRQLAAGAGPGGVPRRGRRPAAGAEATFELLLVVVLTLMRGLLTVPPSVYIVYAVYALSAQTVWTVL